jgi:hypothetical protein
MVAGLVFGVSLRPSVYPFELCSFQIRYIGYNSQTNRSHRVEHTMARREER